MLNSNQHNDTKLNYITNIINKISCQSIIASFLKSYYQHTDISFDPFTDIDRTYFLEVTKIGLHSNVFETYNTIMNDFLENAQIIYINPNSGMTLSDFATDIITKLNTIRNITFIDNLWGVIVYDFLKYLNIIYVGDKNIEFNYDISNANTIDIYLEFVDSDGMLQYITLFKLTMATSFEDFINQTYQTFIKNHKNILNNLNSNNPPVNLNQTLISYTQYLKYIYFLFNVIYIDAIWKNDDANIYYYNALETLFLTTPFNQFKNIVNNVPNINKSTVLFKYSNLFKPEIELIDILTLDHTNFYKHLENSNRVMPQYAYTNIEGFPITTDIEAMSYGGTTFRNINGNKLKQKRGFKMLENQTKLVNTYMNYYEIHSYASMVDSAIYSYTTFMPSKFHLYTAGYARELNIDPNICQRFQYNKKLDNLETKFNIDICPLVNSENLLVATYNQTLHSLTNNLNYVKSVVLYRATNNVGLFSSSGYYVDYRTDTSIITNIFLSTSYNSPAGEFVNKSEIILEIICLPTDFYLIIDQHSMFPGQNEVIIPPYTEFKITGVSYGNYNGQIKKIVTVEYIKNYIYEDMKNDINIANQYIDQYNTDQLIIKYTAAHSEFLYNNYNNYIKSMNEYFLTSTSAIVTTNTLNTQNIPFLNLENEDNNFFSNINSINSNDIDLFDYGDYNNLNKKQVGGYKRIYHETKKKYLLHKKNT